MRVWISTAGSSGRHHDPSSWLLAARHFIRESGVTTKRAEALVAVGALFASEPARAAFEADPIAGVERLISISGIGPWTIQSALLWGIAAPDAHPTRDVALLRAARVHYPDIADLKDLDRVSERWKPYRGWAARLLWLDLLGHEGANAMSGG